MNVRIERSDPVLTVILDRIERKNAVDRPTAEALASAFRTLADDDSLAVGVLFGDHGTFCAGADLKALAEGNGNRVAPDGDGPMGPTRLAIDKPVIGAIAGHAVAGGLELALWCDMRVVEEDAVLGVFCRRWGVPLIDGGTVRLPRIVGLGRAMDLILTGRAVSAEEALRIGLADRVVAKGRAREEAEALARSIASFPQAVTRSDRRSAYDSLSLSFDEAMQNELRHGVAALSSGGLGGVERFVGGAGRHGSFE
jgi:enoyl-CoA hydratase